MPNRQHGEGMVLPAFHHKGLEIKISAPGKVILHGEHSVVYGRLALAASLDIRTKLKLAELHGCEDVILQFLALDFNYTFELQKIKENLFYEHLPLTQNSDNFSWEYPDFIHHESLLDNINAFLTTTAGHDKLNSAQMSAVKCTLYLLAGMLGSVNVEINSFLMVSESDLDIGAGTGSSASYLVCLAAALLQYAKTKKKSTNFSKEGYKSSNWDVDLSRFNEKELDLICKWAYAAEKIVHGTPSGIDNTICTYGSIVEFRKGLDPKLLQIVHPFHILLINTNVSRETKNLVSKVAHFHNTLPDLVNNILNAMEDVAFIALKCIESLNNVDLPQSDVSKFYDELTTLSSINHNLLSALGVSHVKLDEAVLILAQHGLKGKLTGAGGGGYAISLVPPYVEKYFLEKVVADLTHRGFGVVSTYLGGEGVKLD